MNINGEGKYYAAMVRKFRTEYKSKNLHGFCKEQNVSYTKMLHCLRNDSYRKPSAKPVSSDAEQGLHPLVVEPADSVTIIFQIEGFSEDAMMILKLFDAIFREDKLIKAGFSNPDDIRRERVLRIAPMLNDLKSYLDKLAKNLEKEEEPELLKAVNYALTEYPCMLRCLEDGSLDFSNNVCERQIRRIAKYRNNSYFVGSPESGVRFARLMSHFANIRKHNLDPVEYLCDVFRRIKKTAKDKLVDLLAHRWQLATVTSWA